MLTSLIGKTIDFVQGLAGPELAKVNAEADLGYARDRVTESNWARADEREQCAKLAEQYGYVSLAQRIRARG